VLLVECAAVALVVFVANAASRPPAVATLRRLYDDIVYLSVGKSMAEGLGLDAAWLGDIPGPRQAPNANCRVGRTGNGNLGSGTIGDGNFARAGLTLGCVALCRACASSRAEAAAVSAQNKNAP